MVDLIVHVIPFVCAIKLAVPALAVELIELSHQSRTVGLQATEPGVTDRYPSGH